MLSHELSTPLATMRWHAELLRLGKMTTPLDTGQADMVNEIILGATRMGSLINDIHDISRLEQGKFTDEQVPVSLVELVGTLQTKLQADITAKNLTFAMQPSEPAPSVTVRPSIMTIIVQNLLSNAVKYTPKDGSVTVVVRPALAEEITRAQVQENDCLLLSVVDTGYGIPADQQAQVFSKFFRADNVRSLDVDGTGLGLYIVATAVAKLGGGVWFESEVGHGTTVSVVLPSKTRP
jgi:signal transduction histidine kinase